MVGIMEIGSAKFWGMVGQGKMSCAATGRGICPGSVLDCGSRIKSTVKIGMQY